MSIIQCKVWIRWSGKPEGTRGLNFDAFKRLETRPDFHHQVFEELKRQALANGWCTGPLEPYRVDSDFIGRTNTWIVVIGVPDVSRRSMVGIAGRIAYAAGL